MKVTAREGTRFSDADAKVIQSVLIERFPSGEFSAKEILEVARSNRSPIHKYFNWDDTDAAEKYRLIQAQKMIQCLVVEIDDVEVRKYVTPLREIRKRNLKLLFTVCPARKINTESLQAA